MKTPQSLETAEPSVLEGIAATRPSRWWRIGDWLVLLLYSGVVLFTLQFHEKWADEAQAWLLARDFSLKTLWLHELRYEGSPGLWHTLLWTAQRIFRAGYGSIGYIGGACAIGGAAWLIFQTPFPRPLRWLAAFSYFFVYQYAVIARSYVLFALFCLIAADRYRDHRRPGLFALSLVPLALLTAHGSLLAVALGIAYAIRFIGDWGRHDERTQRTFVYSAAGIALLYLFLFAILLPAKDTEATHGVVLTANVILSRTVEGISGALVDNRWLSLAIFLVFASWCWLRKSLTPFLLSVVFLTGLYDYAAGWPHQQGTIFLAVITGLVIAWPTREEQLRLAPFQQRSYTVVVAVLGATFAYQVFAGAAIIRNDVRLPYSGAQDAAQFLRPAVEEGRTIYGYQYGMVAINAYFNRNIFANLPHAYYHHALGEFDPQKMGPEVASRQPNYVVTTWWEPFTAQEFRDKQLIPMAGLGYSLVHMSDGYLLTKTGYSRRQIYAVFKKDR